MVQQLRIFISSPGDVPDERLRADLILDKLAQDYSRYFRFESYRWEHEPMLASGHFQDAIEPPSASDIVILILWSRLGTPLPESTSVRQYRGLDGRAPVTGTEWEFEDALASARARGAPDILVFRNVSPASIDPRDPDARARSLTQLDALDAFWRRYFADRGVFLAASSEYRDLEEFATRLEESLRKLIERRIKSAVSSSAAAAPTWLGNPFRGLQSYEFEHAAIFFGRDALVAKSLEQLASNARAGTAFLLLVGASGSGKSSLVKGALVPRLMKPQRIEGAAFLRRTVFRPGEGQSDQILGLARALVANSAKVGLGLPELLAEGQKVEDFAAYLRAALDAPGFAFSTALGRVTEKARADKRILAYETAKLILVIDQLEELFTLPQISPEERRSFVRLLKGIARCGSVWVVATMRADFWHRILDEPQLLELAEGQGRLEVPPPSPAEIAEMIRKPAQAAGLEFETHGASGLGLDTVLAQEAASEPGVLPLLSFTLDSLYLEDVEKRGGRQLTFRHYESLGGLEGAIANRAEEVIAGLPEAAAAALPRVLRALATLDGATQDTPVARAAPIAAFPPGTPSRAVVDALIAARLLVASQDGEKATVRLAHEALVSRWKRARDQLTTERRDLETRALIERQYARWHQADPKVKPHLLLRDPDLANALDLQRRWQEELGPEVQAFITQSYQRSRRRAQLVTAAALVFGLMAVAASAFGVMAYRAEREASTARLRAVAAEQSAVTERDEALRQRNAALISQSRYLASEADQVVKDGLIPGAVALLRVALPDPGNHDSRPLVQEALASAYKAIYADRALGRVALPFDASAIALDLAANRLVIATGDRLIVREGLSSDHEKSFAHQLGRVKDLLLAPGATRVALIGQDGKLSVRALDADRELMRQAGEGAGTHAFFLNDGKVLAVASPDWSRWHLFEVEGGREIAERQFDSQGKPITVLVDAGHELLIIATPNGDIHRLSPVDLSEAATAQLDPASAIALTASSDAAAIYIASAKDALDGEILVLGSKDFGLQRRFGKVVGGARHVALSSDSKHLAVHGLIGIDFFDVEKGERLYHIITSKDATDGRFLPGGDYLAFGTNGFMRRYSPQLGIELAAYRTMDGGVIEHIHELTDRSGFIAVSDRPSATIWSYDAQVISRQLAVPFVVHGIDMHMPTPIEASWVSDDGGQAHAAYLDHSVRRWNLESGDMTLVRNASEGSAIEYVVALSNGLSVLAEQSGNILVYSDGGGTTKPLAQLATGPAAYLGSLDSSGAFLVSKNGQASRLDLATPSAPKLEPLTGLANCPRAFSVVGFALCLDERDTLRALRRRDGRVFGWPAPPGAKVSSAEVSNEAKLLAISYSNGETSVRSLEDGNAIFHQDLKITLKGDVLKAAAQGPLLSDDDKKKVREGASELAIGLGANALALSRDGRLLAVAMPDRTIRIVDLAKKETREVSGTHVGVGTGLDFSANARLLGVIETGDYQSLKVYDVASGEPLLSISLGRQQTPLVHHLPNGQGFSTIDKTGRILVHPVFENPDDLISFLAKRYPEPLTPAQRRAFFLD